MYNYILKFAHFCIAQSRPKYCCVSRTDKTISNMDFPVFTSNPKVWVFNPYVMASTSKTKKIPGIFFSWSVISISLSSCLITVIICECRILQLLLRLWCKVIRNQSSDSATSPLFLSILHMICWLELWNIGLQSQRGDVDHICMFPVSPNVTSLFWRTYVLFSFLFHFLIIFISGEICPWTCNSFSV